MNDKGWNSSLYRIISAQLAQKVRNNELTKSYE
jgi:hypothetical protein